ncbi:MAG: type II/IV secretion system protein [Flavobacteriales bacterium]|nr:type II/IV secretion system protein [Flavobacteriales bacterium]
MINQEFIDIKVEYQQFLSADQAWHYRIIPKKVSTEKVTFYLDSKVNSVGVQEELELVFGRTVELESLETEILQQTLSRLYRRSKKKQQKDTVLSYSNDDFVLELISEAERLESSDIHIEIYEEKCRVRLRIDGKLIEKYIIHKDEYPAIINKLKIRANLDIAEKRLPQDGRISFSEDGKNFDIRVSVLPTLHGEKIVLRLLSRDATDININALGFEETQLLNYLEGVKKGHGIVLISGPTGSGKTTTLYATLKELNDEKTNIVTIEDPIEYTLEGINQVQLKEQIGLTFSSALKSFLRQDPDIIMLGEIRDGETAKMAIRAALTGHLVLSTIHTNSAWGTISRLVDMGVPPYLLAGTLNVTASQRLVRLLCNNCKQKKELNSSELPLGYELPYDIKEVYEPVGCESCHYTGYTGRKALYEIIPIDNYLASKVRESEYNVTDYLEQKGIRGLDQIAFELLAKGASSIEEVYYLLMTN